MALVIVQRKSTRPGLMHVEPLFKKRNTFVNPGREIAIRFALHTLSGLLVGALAGFAYIVL